MNGVPYFSVYTREGFFVECLYYGTGSRELEVIGVALTLDAKKANSNPYFIASNLLLAVRAANVDAWLVAA